MEEDPLSTVFKGHYKKREELIRIFSKLMEEAKAQMESDLVHWMWSLDEKCQCEICIRLNKER